MSYNINTVLRINGLLGHSPVTFLLDSGAIISVVCLDTLTTDLRSQIQLLGLQHLFMLMAPPGHGRTSENSCYHRQLSH